jgi:hypothetical protein
MNENIKETVKNGKAGLITGIVIVGLAVDGAQHLIRKGAKIAGAARDKVFPVKTEEVIVVKKDGDAEEKVEEK